ncbi:hypothetical protein C922_03627 [Plasmodium inui San Antonio 1]|uniref:14-3-3 domain-containing protein n=1 Tax=Plasmodium inui San Antonio 1 TaxID=1237626 RepID=W7A3I7_9APIC|nr:hypothetical protein C922_03627 [Plasmodium inui San Antonio 1]EUD65903.1 hypothetical protein C922_03627 [Plasmodium inui San Antonio 1]
MKAAERNTHVSNRRPPLLVAKRKGATTANEKGAIPTAHARQSRQKEPIEDERKDALKINIKRAAAEKITDMPVKQKDTPIMRHKGDRKKDKAVNGRTKDRGMHRTGSTHRSSSHRKNNAGVEKPNVRPSSPHLSSSHRRDNAGVEKLHVGHSSHHLVESQRSEESWTVTAGIAIVGETSSSRKKTTQGGKIKNLKRYKDFNKGKNMNDEKEGMKNIVTSCETRVSCQGNSKPPKLAPLTVEGPQGAPSPTMLSSQKIHSQKNHSQKIHSQKIPSQKISSQKIPSQKIYPHDDIHIMKVCIENQMNRKEKVQKMKNKILKMYSDLFVHHFRRSQKLIKSSGNADLNVFLNRESVHSFLRLSYKYGDYDYCVGFVMVLLLDRLTNAEVELTPGERDDLENAVRAYNYHTLLAYRGTFKAYHKFASNAGDDDASVKKTLQNGKRKTICSSIRAIIKDKFLLNCEAMINMVNCILSTINEEKEKIYYSKLNANQYKTISDITETGVKYKYEQLARETYKKAFELAQVHLVPTDVHFLQLASRYISFLYFNVGQEQLALEICTAVFDRTTDQLTNMQDEGEADRCLQILSRMRYNIKRWSRKLHGNSILFLDF